MEVKERSDHHAGGQEYSHHGNTQEDGDVLREGCAETPGEPTDPHTVEDIKPGGRPEADWAADEPDEQNHVEKEW